MRRVVAAAAWVVLAVGCEQPRTELVARVDSEVAWGPGERVRSVTLTVRRGGPAGPLRSLRAMALGTEGDRRPLPLSVGILPGDDVETPIWIEALGCGEPNGCTPTTAVVAQRAVVRFTRGQTEEVLLLLASACVGATCGSDERCGEGGRCEPAIRAKVRPFDGSDAGTVADVAGGMDRVVVADVPVTDMGFRPERNDVGAVGDVAASVDAPALDISGADGGPALDAETPCGPLELRCGGTCTRALTDSANCGDCGVVCPAVAGATATCMGGRCGYACDVEHADCDERPSNGCESALTTDRGHCGSCATHCNDWGSCVAGACVDCPVVRDQQNFPCGDRCVDLGYDATNCGRCGNVCPMGGQCRTGTCVGGCPAGMRYVPADLFEMGSDLQPDEQPRHVVRLSAFCLDETEVTVVAYGACVTAGRCSAATGFMCNASALDRGNHPVNCVDWNRSRTYCRWLGGDLPTEAQWEFAARGTDGRRYPWGNAEPSDQPNFASAGTVPVRSFPRDVSPFGLFDMGGNVSEWVSDWYGPYTAATVMDPTGAAGTTRVHRGGHFNTSHANEVRAARRDDQAPTFAGAALGFRCARMP